MDIFVAVTDRNWFDYLSIRAAPDGRLDEVNFWSPSSTLPLKRLMRGQPVFFRLKAPVNAIVGYGFFAHFAVLGLENAWDWFGEKNGDPDQARFLQRIGAYRKLDLFDRSAPREPLGCTLLRDVHFWPEPRWLPWGESVGWKPNIVRGRTERDPVLASRLLGEIQFDHMPVEEFAEVFEPLEIDERDRCLIQAPLREGQGTFRARLLDTYTGRCSVTGEHTEVVLDAAHIQPYLGPRSNHVQNGILMTKEFHALFDRGYMTVTPEYEVRISPRLKRDFQNGRRYYPYDGARLEVLPERTKDRPSPPALEWHAKRVFLD